MSDFANLEQSQAFQPQKKQEQHVMIIDGAYLQIGIKDLNEEHGTNF